jgi:hypothetical protein
VLGFCVLFGDRASGATCSVTGYNFPPLSGESSVLALWWGSEGSLAVRDSGECWASVLCGEGSLLVPKNSKSWSLRFTWVCGGRMLALNSKLRVLWGSRTGRLELSGAYKAEKALGSTCVGA